MHDESGGHSARIPLIGSDGEHGLGREILCSLPRTVSCRLCKGEHDCPYVVERPLGRLIVRRREPQSLVIRDLLFVSTGSENRSGTTTPMSHRLLILLSWLSLPALISWVVFVHRPNVFNLIAPGIVMLVTFFATIIGVPIVRWLWRDHGGRRRGGAWRPS